MRKHLLKSLFVLFVMFFADKASACTSNITTWGSTSVCSGDSVFFQAYPLGQQYQWYVNGVPVVNGGSLYMTQGLTAGTNTIYCDVTDQNNCVATSNSIVITVSNGPVISSVSNNGPICAGSTLNLTCNVTGATSYSWYGPGSFTSTSQNPSISNAQTSNSGNYTVMASDGVCTAYGYTNAVVNGTNPTVTIGTSGTTSCEGDSFFVWSTVSGLTNVSYSWTGPNSFTSSASYFDIQNTTVANSGTYYLTVTGTGCSGTVTLTDQVTMTVNATPVVTATSNGPICAGNTLNLTGTVSTGTYSWSGPGSFTSTSLTPSITNAQTSNSGNYILTANNGNCVASATVNVVVMTNNPQVYASADSTICAGQDMNLYSTVMNITGATYSWSGPNSFTSAAANPTILSATTAAAGTYTLTVTGTSCGGSVTLTANVLVNVVNCDSVWPGDANSDLVANNSDVLTIGLLYGEWGAARTGASMNWVGQPCVDWTTVMGGVNAKHADCDGSGYVDSSDVWAVTMNYGQTHVKGGPHVPQPKSAGLPDLYFDMTGIVFEAGTQVTVPIKFGTTTTIMQNMYGIATQVKIAGVTPTSGLTVNANTSWVGNLSNAINFTESVSNTQTDWTYVRKDHNNISGNGTIGSVTFTVPAGSEYQTIQLYFDNVSVIDNNGNPITAINILDGGGMVFPLGVGNKAASIVNSAAIVPNPSDAQASLQLSLAQAAKVNVVVTDITGRMIWNAEHNAIAGSQDIQLPASKVAPGVYTIQVRDDKGAVAQSLKWIKK